MLPPARAIHPRLPCRRHTPGCLRRRRKRRRSCRPRTSTAFHRLIKGISIRDVDEETSTLERRERRKRPAAIATAQKEAQRRLHDPRHALTPARRLLLEACGKGVIEHEGRLHAVLPYPQYGSMSMHSAGGFATSFRTVTSFDLCQHLRVFRLIEQHLELDAHSANVAPSLR